MRAALPIAIAFLPFAACLVHIGELAHDEPDAAAVPPTSDAGAFCDDATFCDEFERTELQGPWDGVSMDLGGAATITPTDGGRALEVTLSATNGSRASLAHQLPLASRVRYHYEVRVEPGFAGRNVDVCPITYRYESPRSVTFLVVLNASLDQLTFALTEQGGIGFHALGAVGLFRGQWSTIDIEIDHGRSPQRYIARRNGVVVVDEDLTVSAGPAAPVVAAGATFSTSGPATMIHVDDLRVDVTP